MAQGRVTATHRAVEEFDARGVGTDLLLVDPPRTGMSRAAMDAALALGAPRVVYVSCDVATLARDSRRLVDAGYSLKRIDAFDMFPNTPHVETIVEFENVRI
jgi:23S rRNA (uracil1939-C5)-methyltransferase